MAIVKMKKLRLMAVRSQREELLRELMLLGCVELSEPKDLPEEGPEAGLTRGSWDELVQGRSQQHDMLKALRLLDHYAPEKKKLLQPRPDAAVETVLDESTLEDNIRLAEEVIRLEDQIRRLTAEESRERVLIESLTPWKELPLSINCTGTETCAAILGTVHGTVDLSELRTLLNDAVDGLAELYVVSSDQIQHCLVLICMRSVQEAALTALRTQGFSMAALGEGEGNPKKNIKEAEQRLAEIGAKKEELAGKISALASRREEFRLRIDTLNNRLARAEAGTQLLFTESAFVCSGWITAPDEPRLAEVLSKYDCAWETEDPDPENPAEVPVKLKSNRLTKPYTVITEMYSLPAYNGIDPNPFIMPGFALFFGIMFADMAYGLIMALAGLFLIYKVRPRGTLGNMAGLLVQCGISTFIMGFLVGGFFGDAIPVLGGIFGKEWTLVPTFGAVQVGSISIALPLNLLEGNNPLYVLVAALILGVIHLAVGVGIGVYLKIRDGEWLDALLGDLSWWVIFAGIGVLVLKGSSVLIYVGLAMVVLGGVLKGKGFGRVTGVFGALYNGVTGYLGDILSYSRLMALMLAGSVIASVFNQLGALGGVILFIPVFLIGHVLNFGLNIIGCFVHTMRLQFLEFFGKWYRDGGRPFRPLAVETNYVDIKEEN
ncbi:MAG: V-type ATP synthase subunit I [Eubacteriales bacterium]|nr:V-type ATP synthase subunit I [Eubacteriales bacterium]